MRIAAISGLGQLQRYSEQIVARGNRTQGLKGLFNSSGANTPWLYLDIDRTKCEALGVSVSDVFNTLQVYLGSYYVNNFNEFGRTWQVNVQADPQFRDRIPDVRQLQVRNNQGQMVRLATLMDVRDTSGPVMVMRYNLYSAAAITGDAAPGTSSGQAMELMQTIADKELPPSMAYEWTDLGVSADSGRQHGDVVLRAGRAVRVFGAGGAVRKLVVAAGRNSGRADVPAVLGRRRAAGAQRRQHLHADRICRAGRSGEQECDSDRRVRQAAA